MSNLIKKSWTDSNLKSPQPKTPPKILKVMKVKRKYMNKLLKHQLAKLQIKVQLRKIILLKILTKIPMRKLKK